MPFVAKTPHLSLSYVRCADTPPLILDSPFKISFFPRGKIFGGGGWFGVGGVRQITPPPHPWISTPLATPLHHPFPFPLPHSILRPTRPVWSTVYSFGPDDTNACISPYVLITDSAVCDLAGQELLGSGAKGAQYTIHSSRYNDRPKGCHMWIATGQYFFNPYTVTPTNPQGRPICMPGPVCLRAPFPGWQPRLLLTTRHHWGGGGGGG